MDADLRRLAEAHGVATAYEAGTGDAPRSRPDPSSRCSACSASTPTTPEAIRRELAAVRAARSAQAAAHPGDARRAEPGRWPAPAR